MDLEALTELSGGTNIRRRYPREAEFDPGGAVLADLIKWRIQIRQDFNDLFQRPKGVPPPGKDEFHILTDPTTKLPHYQPYWMTPAEIEEFKKQIKKLYPNSWVTDSHSQYAAPVIFVKKRDSTALRMCVDTIGV